MVYEDLFGRKYTDEELNNFPIGWFECLELHMADDQAE